MSGIFLNGVFHENTDLICRKCKSPVWESDNPEYEYQCLKCHTDLTADDTEEQDPHYHPQVKVGRPINGLTINGGLEYLLDNGGKEMIFKDQVEAEMFLMAHDIDPVDEVIYFIEFENE